MDEAVTLFSQKAAGTRSAPADEEQVSRQPQRDVPVTDAGRVNADEPRVMKRRARRIQFGKSASASSAVSRIPAGKVRRYVSTSPIAWLAWYLTMRQSVQRSWRAAPADSGYRERCLLE